MPTPDHVCRPNVLCFACFRSGDARPPIARVAEVAAARPQRSPFGTPESPLTFRQVAHRRAMLMHLRQAR